MAENEITDNPNPSNPPNLRYRTKRNTLLVLLALLPAVVLIVRGAAASFHRIRSRRCILGGCRNLPRKAAYRAINLRIVLFLGSMLSLSAILQDTGALSNLVYAVLPAVRSLSPFWLVAAFVFLSGIFANILDNSVAAVLLSPAGVLLSQTGAVSVGSDAILMAVAAGCQLGIVFPIHQATVVTWLPCSLNEKFLSETVLRGCSFELCWHRQSSLWYGDDHKP